MTLRHLCEKIETVRRTTAKKWDYDSLQIWQKLFEIHGFERPYAPSPLKIEPCYHSWLPSPLCSMLHCGKKIERSLKITQKKLVCIWVRPNLSKNQKKFAKVYSLLVSLWLSHALYNIRKHSFCYEYYFKNMRGTKQGFIKVFHRKKIVFDTQA